MDFMGIFMGFKMYLKMFDNGFALLSTEGSIDQSMAWSIRLLTDMHRNVHEPEPLARLIGRSTVARSSRPTGRPIGTPKFLLGVDRSSSRPTKFFHSLCLEAVNRAVDR